MWAWLRSLMSRASVFPAPPQNTEWIVTPKSNAGVVINEATAMNISVVLACVRAICEPIGFLPWETDSPELDRLINSRPNPYISGISFREYLTKDALLHGAGYAEIVPGPIGVELYVIPSTRIRPMVDEVTGERYYEVEEQEGLPVRWSWDRVFVLPGL